MSTREELIAEAMNDTISESVADQLAEAMNDEMPRQYMIYNASTLHFDDIDKIINKEYCTVEFSYKY